MAITVQSVAADSPIRHAISCGDRIVHIDGFRVTNANLMKVLKGKNYGELRRIAISYAGKPLHENTTVLTTQVGLRKGGQLMVLGINYKREEPAEDIHEIARKRPYNKFITFPIEINEPAMSHFSNLNDIRNESANRRKQATRQCLSTPEYVEKFRSGTTSHAYRGSLLRSKMIPAVGLAIAGATLLVWGLL